MSNRDFVISFVYLILIIVLWFSIICINTEQDKEDKEKIQYLKREISHILPSVKNLEIYPGSYTRIYRKRNIYIKLRDENGRFYDDNTLKYVLLHELSHIISTVTDTSENYHSDEFYKINDKIIKKATDYGVYNFLLDINKNY